MTQIIPTAEPFFFPGQFKAGCLLIHGFTGTPKEMRGMGEYLAAKGYAALGVRLAGHATRAEDMMRSTYLDWMASVEDGYRLLKGVAPSVYLIGLSMGAVLSLRMATELGAKGIVAMSTPFQLPRDYPLWMIRLVSLFQPLVPKSKDPPGSGWFDQEARRDQVSYARNPTRSAGELKQLLAEMRAALPQVTAPTLLMHSRDDTYVRPDSMALIHDALGARDKQMLWITGSGHVITRDASRQVAFEAAAAFVRRQEGSP